MSDSLIQQIEKRAYHNEISLVAGRDHLSTEQKSYVRLGHERGINFLMPIVKLLLEQRDKWTQVAQLDLKIISESENAEILKLLKDKQNE